MQLESAIDHSAASLGGRDNTWRSLTGSAASGDSVLADFIAFTQTGRLTQKLSGAIPRLSPSIVSLSPAVTAQLMTARSSEAIRALNREARHVRRTRVQRSQRLDHMRRVYGVGGVSSSPIEESRLTITASTASTATHPFASSQSFRRESGEMEGREGYRNDWEVEDEETWDEEGGELYQWSQELPVDDNDF